MKKYVAMLILLLILASVFTGCGEEPSSSVSESKITLPASMEALKTAEVGDKICFGFFNVFESEYDDPNEKVIHTDALEWKVIAKTEDSVLLICTTTVAEMPFNNTSGNVTWETCSMRKWLNNNFLTQAFTEEEQAVIKSVTVPADKINPDVNPGNDTTDKVFILSVSEYMTYIPTGREKEHMNFSWVRTPGEDNSKAVYLEKGGYGMEGEDVTNVLRVYPAIWARVR